MHDDQKRALLADLERYVIRPIGPDEISVRDVQEEFGLSYSAARQLLQDRIAHDGWTSRVALVNGRRGTAYRGPAEG